MPVLPYFDTELVGDESAITFQERLTRCYELAGYAITLGTVPDGATLAHGTIHAKSLPNAFRLGHAWLELPNDVVWEPVSRKIWSASAWEAFAHPVVERRFNASEARRAVIRHAHWGPWTASRAGRSEEDK